MNDSSKEELVNNDTRSNKKTKPRLRRSLSYYVLDTHIPVEVHDSHAYGHGTSVRRKRLSKKYKSLEDMTEIRNKGAKERSKSDYSKRANQRTLFDEVQRESEKLPPINLGLTNNTCLVSAIKDLYGTNSRNGQLYNNMASLESFTDFNMPKNNDGKMSSRSLYGNGTDETVRSKKQWKSRKKSKKNYTLLPPICERKAENCIGTLEMYKKHEKMAKIRAKQVNAIQERAKDQQVLSQNAKKFDPKRRRSQKPRKLSPLGKRPLVTEVGRMLEVPCIKEPKYDLRFQRLLQCLAKINIR